MCVWGGGGGGSGIVGRVSFSWEGSVSRGKVKYHVRVFLNLHRTVSW